MSTPPTGSARKASEALSPIPSKRQKTVPGMTQAVAQKAIDQLARAAEGPTTPRKASVGTPLDPFSPELISKQKTPSSGWEVGDSRFDHSPITLGIGRRLAGGCQRAFRNDEIEIQGVLTLTEKEHGPQAAFLMGLASMYRFTEFKKVPLPDFDPQKDYPFDALKKEVESISDTWIPLSLVRSSVEDLRDLQDSMYMPNNPDMPVVLNIGDNRYITVDRITSTRVVFRDPREESENVMQVFRCEDFVRAYLKEKREALIFIEQRSRRPHVVARASPTPPKILRLAGWRNRTPINRAKLLQQLLKYVSGETCSSSESAISGTWARVTEEAETALDTIPYEPVPTIVEDRIVFKLPNGKALNTTEHAQTIIDDEVSVPLLPLFKSSDYGDMATLLMFLAKSRDQGIIQLPEGFPPIDKPLELTIEKMKELAESVDSNASLLSYRKFLAYRDLTLAAKKYLPIIAKTPTGYIVVDEINPDHVVYRDPSAGTMHIKPTHKLELACHKLIGLKRKASPE